MYCRVENTFIAIKSHTSSAGRSASLPAVLRDKTPEPDEVETLEERASALLSDFVEVRNANANGCAAKVQDSLPLPVSVPSPMAPERNDTDDVQVAFVGSLGHPEFCRKPCLLMVRQFWCPNGRQCGFCHHPHHDRSMTLDKRQRLALRSLSEQEQLNHVLPRLKARAKQFPRAIRVIDLMDEHLARLEVPEPSSSSTPMLKDLSRATRKMSFNRLTEMCPCSKLEPIQSAILQLRASYGEASAD
ncbi:unnamed protein product [Effrenium voratum]|nr:unnamed protein product [Effrenium voratum]